MSRPNSPHRTPERESFAAATPTAARHRLAATLGGPDAPGHPAGLLELPELPELPRAGDGAAEDPAVAERERRPGTARLRHRTGLRAAVLLGAVAAVLSGWFWWCAATGAPDVVPLSEVSAAGAREPAGNADPDTATADPGAAAEPGSQAAGQGTVRILVHVAGAVVHPGVVELPEGSRIREAIAAAGGSAGTADPDRLNLAAVVEDGQKVLVPERGDAAAPGDASDGAGRSAVTGTAETGTAETGAAGTGAGGGAGAGGVTAGAVRINLNTAGVAELGTLPRVGPVLAQRIVDWRKEHGRFQAVEELDAVDGVGPKLLAALLPLVRV